MDIKLCLKQIIENTLKDLNIEFDYDKIVIETPKSASNGDLSTNIAMQLTKVLKDNPRNIAEKLVNKIKENEKIEKVEIAGPGFINIYLKDEYLISGVKNVVDMNEEYGKNNIGNNKKINIEFVSANPTGILHLGTARGAAYGANLANILSFSSYDVTKEYYINDAGNQINNLGISLKERYKGICGLEEAMPEDGYYGNEIIDIAKEIYSSFKDSKLNEDLEYFKEYAVSYLLDIIKQDLTNFGVTFNVWTSEKAIRRKGRIEESLKFFEENGLIFEQ